MVGLLLNSERTLQNLEAETNPAESKAWIPQWYTYGQSPEFVGTFVALIFHQGQNQGDHQTVAINQIAEHINVKWSHIS